MTRPTDEQTDIVTSARAGADLSIQALAGTGKTTTLTLVARALRGKGQYVAFNKAIVDESRPKFPKQNFSCSTAHSLAFRAVGHRYQSRLNPNQRLTSTDIANLFSIPPFSTDLSVGRRYLEPRHLASLAQRTVRAFCSTPDAVLSARHVPPVHQFGELRAREELCRVIVPIAERMWADVQSLDGRLKFEHDHYLKIWQLSRPTISCDYILFDEAQDANPVMLTVVNDQDAQLIYCGDQFQSIYEWRGAVDALRLVHVDETRWLTQSFRFGPAVANLANDILNRLRSAKSLQGWPGQNSRIGGVERPNAILARTNAGVVAECIQSLNNGFRTAVVGNVTELIDFARACEQLIHGQRTGHPELAPFANWDEVHQWIADEPDESAGLQAWVNLVGSYTAAGLIRYLESCTSEANAQVTVSTAHRAKGREWKSVRLSNDFAHLDDMGVEDLRLAYVAVTRAREQLDLDKWRSVAPRAATPAIGRSEVGLLQPAPRTRPRRPPISF